MLNKKINSWISEHSLILLLVLIIAVIPLYVFQFNEFFTDNSIKLIGLIVDIFVALAAVISTYFLFLTFKQAKVANELKIYESSFEEFGCQIAEKEKLVNTSVFSDEEEKIIYDIYWKSR